MARRFPIVGVGSSAGGVGALQRLFEALPSATGLAFVVQHPHPLADGQLSGLLRGATPLGVIDAVDGALVEREHVYVSAPGQVLTLANGALRSWPCPERDALASGPIDALFESLAADRGEGAVGVVLSGAGDDGSRGALRIKRAGGRVFVQDPATAPYDGMPRATLATGAADGALGLGALARALCEHALSGAATAPERLSREHAEPVLEQVRRLVRARHGVDLGGYKPRPLLWRIRRRAELEGAGSLAEYAERLAHDEAALEALIQELPIHVTSFFRDPAAWEFFAEHALAPLLAARAGGPPIRAWTAACSSGEEAYSLAMLLSEQARRLGRAPDYRVFATDLSGEVVARASRGWFPAAAAQALSAERLERFFEPCEGGYRVTSELRSLVVFARHDLLGDPPLSNLDVLTCRNVLIYMAPAAQARALSALREALREGGVLLLGPGEPFEPAQQGFGVESEPHRIYRKLLAEPLGWARLGSAGPRLGAEGAAALAARALERGEARSRRVEPARFAPAGFAPAETASRAELQALCEELLSVKDQLEFANERLARAGEQLNLSNEQLTLALEELAARGQALPSAAVKTLYLDERLGVRWFSPAVRELIPVRPADVGRPVADLATRFDDPAFLDDVRAVLASGEPRSGQVKTRDGRRFSRHIGPHARGPEQPAGVVVRFTEVPAPPAEPHEHACVQSWSTVLSPTAPKPCAEAPPGR